MPRFFFHVFDGVDQLDTEGVELMDWRASRAHAVAKAGQIHADDSVRLSLGDTWQMVVTDSQGLVLFRLDFSVLEAPAAAAPHSAN